MINNTIRLNLSYIKENVLLKIASVPDKLVAMAPNRYHFKAIDTASH